MGTKRGLEQEFPVWIEDGTAYINGARALRDLGEDPTMEGIRLMEATLAGALAKEGFKLVLVQEDEDSEV